MPKVHHVILPVLATALLAACSDSEPGSAGGPIVDPGTGTARGTLLQSPPELASTATAPSLLLELDSLADGQLLSLLGTPSCDVAVHRIRYATVGGTNEPTTASAALMVPTGADAQCKGSRPMLLYAHGTSPDRAFNIADLRVDPNGEGLAIAAIFAAQGYIVVAPNYAGYDISTLTYHPYLVADQQSKDMIDALAAARSALPTAAAPATTDGGKLFITGYSQGGYVAMATHRAMQAAGMTVTASAPMSGPYAIAAFVDAIFFGRVGSGATRNAAMLFTAYQRSHGEVYGTAGDLFEPQYATGIESLLPTSVPMSQIYADGRLPRDSLFSSTAPDPSFTDITPATSPVQLAPIFAAGFGVDHLVRNDFRLSYLLDAQANPDGGWPTTTSGLPAPTPGLGLRRALKANDLRNWTPSAPVLLCGGNEDPTVFWLNAQLMQGYWTSSASTIAPVTLLDLDSDEAGDNYADLRTRFGVAKQLAAAAAVAEGASDGGEAAVAATYHSGLVPPFCLAAVRSFFENR